MSTDWQARFQQLAVQQEEDARRFADAERVLCRTIVRLCTVSSGFDPILDPHLAHLKATVKDGYQPALEQRLVELGDALVSSAEDTGGLGLLDRLLRRMALPAKQERQLQRAWQAVARNPANASDEALDEILVLLGWSPQLEAASPGKAPVNTGGGLFGRLLKGGAARPPNRVLDELLGRIAWPQSLSDEIDALRKDLAADAPNDAWVGVVERLSGLVLRVMQNAQAQVAVAESFLAELTSRLNAIEVHVSSEAGDRDAARMRGEKLSAAVQSEVNDVSGQLRDSTDLGQLKISVSNSLDRLQHFVDGFLSAERRRHDDAVAREAALREELARVERESQKLRDQIALSQDQASRDALTGLPNRRAYDDRMAEELARLKRFGDPLSLVVFDLDNFKQINDRFGHKAGDKALKVIARLLTQRLRETDFLARYGGEEFVLLLPGSSSEDAQALAEHMRVAVAAAGLHSKGKPVPLTVSGGVASLHADDTADTAFERADRALYQAKAAGKDQIVQAVLAAQP